MTARRTWQRVEGRAAALFGCRRLPLSGSSGRTDVSSCSDSTHPTLYIETKLRGRHTARALHDETRARAKREAKVPVLMLADKGRAGFLVCVHSDDLPALFDAYQQAQTAEALRDGQVVARRGRRRRRAPPVG